MHLRPRSIDNLKLDRVHIGRAAADAVVVEADLRGCNRVVIVTPHIIVDSTPIVQPVADAGALHGLRLLGRSLSVNLKQPEDLDARLESQTAVWLACAGINRVPYGASHGIGHQLGAASGVPHGYTSCVMLPHVMAFNESVTAGAQELIADALGRCGEPASSAVADLIAGLGMPTRLREVGVERAHFDEIASGSLFNTFVRVNPQPIDSAEQVMELLERAY